MSWLLRVFSAKHYLLLSISISVLFPLSLSHFSSTYYYIKWLSNDEFEKFTFGFFDTLSKRQISSYLRWISHEIFQLRLPNRNCGEHRRCCLLMRNCITFKKCSISLKWHVTLRNYFMGTNSEPLTLSWEKQQQQLQCDSIALYHWLVFFSCFSSIVKWSSTRLYWYRIESRE